MKNCRSLMTKIVLTTIFFYSLFKDHDLYGTENSVTMSPRHIMIIQADLDYIWGSYYFALTNHDKSPHSYKTKISLPKESIDFQPQDGLTNNDISLDEDGNLSLEKMITPGLNLLGIGFKVKTKKFGHDFISLSQPFKIEELSVASPVMNKLDIYGKKFNSGLPPMLPKESYRGIQADNINSGEMIELEIRGIPKLKHQLLIVGAITFLLLTIICTFLTFKTIPNKDSKLEDQVI